MKKIDATYVRVKMALTFIILWLSNAVNGQSDTLWYAHRAFGEGRYDEAITAYQAAIDEGSTWTWLPDLIEIVEIRKNLGMITPADTHNIMVIFVRELNEVTDSGTITSTDVTNDQKETWKVYFDVFKQTIVSFSSGNWTIHFDSIDAVSTYPSNTNLAPDNPDHLNLGADFFSNMSDHDSYITFSNTRSPARGLARQYPYINGVLYGPDRGMAAINSGTHGYGILLHEFFHIIEWVSNAIGVTHGFEEEERHNFPDWTGETEFDYYRWHFSETLSTYPWNRLNHRVRWLPFESKIENFNALVEEYTTIPLYDRQLADTLFNEAKALKNSDLEMAVGKWNEALSLSPYHPASLLEVHNYHKYVTLDEELAADAWEKLKLVRSVTGFYTLDTVNRDYGQAVGLWFPEDISEDWEFFDWDVTPYVSRSGCYDATFYYTDGFKALDIDSVSMSEDGFEVALDAHIGFSGNERSDITYNLRIPEFKNSSKYLLKAKIKGNGGTDSYGQIQMLYVSDSCTIDEEITTGSVNPASSPEIRIYPNPTSNHIVIKGAANKVLRVIDNRGIMFYRKRMESDNEVIDPNLHQGMYFVQIEMGKKIINQRILIK